MAKENWVDHVLNRAKDAPIIGRAAAYVADRRETARREDAFWKVVDVSISNHEHELQMKEWRSALPQPLGERPELLSDRRLAGVEAQERPRTPRGEVAHRLDAAAYNRSWAMHDKAHGRDQSVNRNIDYAKRNIEAAREIRLSASRSIERSVDHGIAR